MKCRKSSYRFLCCLRQYTKKKYNCKFNQLFTATAMLGAGKYWAVTGTLSLWKCTIDICTVGTRVGRFCVFPLIPNRALRTKICLSVLYPDTKEPCCRVSCNPSIFSLACWPTKNTLFANKWTSEEPYDHRHLVLTILWKKFFRMHQPICLFTSRSLSKHNQPKKKQTRWARGRERRPPPPPRDDWHRWAADKTAFFRQPKEDTHTNKRSHVHYLYRNIG